MLSSILAMAIVAQGANAQPLPRTASTPTAPAPAVPANEIQGVVLQPDGKPAIRARVALVPTARAGEVPAAPLIKTTDAAGAFRFEVGALRDFGLQAHLPPLALTTLQHLKGGRRVALKLEAGSRVSGMVSDAVTGRPIEGAEIEASEWDVSPFVEADPDFGMVRARSDPKGQFTLIGLASSGRLIARARRRGFATSNVAGVPPSGLKFRLEPGHDLQGLLVDSENRPVPGAAILLRPTVRKGSDSITLRSNTSGRFEAMGLKNIAYDLTVTAEGFAPALRDAVGADTPSITVTLERPSRVTGRLVDEGNKALKGVIRVRSWSGEAVPTDVDRSVTAEAGPDGRFSLAGLKVGSNVLALRAASFSIIERKVEISKPGETIALGDVRFERGLTITGRVASADDVPVIGARIAATRPSQRGSDPFFAATNDDGRFELAGLEGDTYQLSISADGFFHQTLKASPSEETLNVLMRKAITISGRVVEGTGQPVVRARVSAQKGTDSSGAAGGQSASDGRFTLELGETGEFQLSVVAEGYKPLNQTIQATAGADLGDVRLSRGLVVRGIVVDSKGLVIGGARVENQTTRQFPTTFVETDEKGQFELPGADSGRVRLTATHFLFAPGQTFVEVKDGEDLEDARITLGSGGRVEGVVRQRDSTPVGRALIQLWPINFNDPLRPAGTGALMATTDTNGSFTFDHVFPGAMTVTLLTGQQGSYTNIDQASVTLAEGETTTVNLILRATTVRGVVRRTSESAAGLRVTMRGPNIMMSLGQQRIASVVDEIPWHAATTDETGRFALRIVTPVNAQVFVASADRLTPLLSKEVRVPDVDEYPLSLDVAGTRITGRVVEDEGGKGISDASVSVRPFGLRPSSGNDGSRYARTDTAGTFAFELDPGKYRLSATADGYAGATGREFTVTAAQASLDDVTLSKGGALSGRVTLDGRPVSQARVDASARSLGAIQSRWTGVDGFFSIPGLPNEAIRLVASDESGHVGVHLQAAGSTDSIEVTLAPAARIVVTLVGPPPALVMATVTLPSVDDYPHTAFARADPQGRATLFSPPGMVTARAFSDGFEGEARVQAESGTTVNITIEMRPKKASPPKI